MKMQIIFDREGQGMRNALTEWEWRSVKVNMELLKYLPRPVGGLQGNQRCYSGKLADTQNHLELIMACKCTKACACAHINTHRQTCRRTQTRVVYVLQVYIPPTCLHTCAHTHMHAVISDVPQGAGLCGVATLWAPFGVHNTIGRARLNSGSE